MTYHDFLTRVIDDGVAAARRDYARPDQKHKLEGSVAGFEACRGKTPDELSFLLGRVHRAISRAYVCRTPIRRYWRLRCFEAEVEWICNVVSAAFYATSEEFAHTKYALIVQPTARGVMKAAEILGVRGAP